jgi:hypothetical protein
MKLRILILGFLTAAATADRPVDGQEREFKEPYAFFSSTPIQPADTDPDPKTKLQSLYLRPNHEQSAYVFVRNPTNSDAVLNVILTAGEEKQAGSEIARADGLSVRAKTTVRVPLAAAGKAPAPPPPPPAAPGDKDSAKSPPPPAGVKLGKTQLALRVEYADEPNAKQRDIDTRLTYELDVWKPVEFINSAASYNPNTKQFIVKLSFQDGNQNPYLTNAPVKVRLDLRPDLNKVFVPESLTKGTYEAELPLSDDPAQQSVQLVAEGVEFLPGQQRLVVVAVSVDGYDRAFLYETDFRSPNPTPRQDQFVNIKPAAEKLVPGQPCRLQLEFSLQNVDEDKMTAELRVDRLRDGTFTDVVKRFLGLRKKEIYVRPGGSDDAVLFTTVLTDWDYDFPTTNVFGEVAFQLLARGEGLTVPSPRESDNAAARFNIRNERAIILDRTPPRIEEFTPPRAATLITGAKVTVRARVTEDLTGFQQVLFYLGDAPPADAKLVPGKIVRGRLVRENAPRDHIYEGTLTLPQVRGPVSIGVRVVNEVGLIDVEDEKRTQAVIEVRDPPAPKAQEPVTTGTIIGRVLQGSRPQPGLPVELRDDTGKIVKATQSDENGQFKFENVLPGVYVVWSYKKVDAARGSDTVAVEVGKTSHAAINVLRGP